MAVTAASQAEERIIANPASGDLSDALVLALTLGHADRAMGMAVEETISTQPS